MALLGQVSRSVGLPRAPRLYEVSATLAMAAKYYAGLGPRAGALPDPDKAFHHPDGLAGIATDLSEATLIAAYAKGLFPFSRIGPQKWWAPRERMVLFPERTYLPSTLRQLIADEQFDVTFDGDFGAVIEACAEPRQGTRRPIRPDIIQAFTGLYHAGYAHSVEVWDRAGNLAGGLCGLAVGKVFFTEAMFSRAREASKVGFVTLSRHLQHWGFVLNDGKRMSGHLSQLGFTLIPRDAFNRLLAQACRAPARSGAWSLEENLDVSRWNPKAPRLPSSRKGLHATVLELS